MNIKEMRALAQLMEASGLNVIEITEADTKIRLEKNAPPPSAQNAAAQFMQPTQSIYAPPQQQIKAQEGAVDFNRITEIKSPVVGVFYAAASPEAEPYVKIGSKVKKGDVLCIIEAMKLMNEVIAEVDGEIVDICVENTQVVEYAQVLFKVF